MSDVPSNLIPTRITQLPTAPVADENSLMMIVYQGNNYQIRVGDLLSVAGVPTSTQVIAGTGMTGGGALTGNVTLSIAPGGVGSTQLASSGVTPGVYGDSTNIPVFTVDDTGRVMAASSIPVSVSGYVPQSRQVIAGDGLNGGGTLNANVTLAANLSNAAPLAGDGVGAAGTSLDISRADHQHPAVNLGVDAEVDGILGLSNGGTAKSLVPDAGAMIWCGADGLYVGPVGSSGQVLVSSGTGEYAWGSALLVVDQPANVVYAGPASGPDAPTAFRTLVPADIPTLNQNTTGTAANVTGVVAVLNGGTGATTAGTARSNLSAAKSGANTDITSVALTTGTVSTTPSTNTDIVNKLYVDSTAQGLNFHEACQYASTANFTAAYNNGVSGVGATLTNSGALAAFAIDGYTFVSPGDVGKRVLIKNQSAAAENGVYTVTTVGSGAVAWVLTRATDFDTPGTGANQIDAGDFFYILGGTANANTSWVQQTPLPITVGVTALTFIQFGAASGGVSSFSAGTTGLTPNTATTGNITLAGTLAVANGGTGATTAPNALTNLAAAGTGISNTFIANQIVSVTDNVNAALRITQLSTATNAIALLVEDSANPDSTPFVIDATGKVIAGYTTPITTSGSFSPLIQSVAAGQTAGFGTSAWLNSTAGGNVIFAKSRSGTIGTFGIVSSGDDLGSVRFDGDDGTQFVRAAQITSQVDGTPGTNDMPGRLVFSTTADGASTPTERMRIDSAGNVGIGGTAGSDTKFQLLGTYPTSGTNTFVQQSNGTSPSGTTNVLSGYRARINTQAAAFALSNSRVFDSGQGTIGAGSSVTNQYGYWADSSLTGATNNYGFYGNIAAPTTGITTAGTISTISSSGTTVTVNHSAGTYTNGQTVTITATAVITNLVIGVPVTILTLGSTTTQANWNTLAGTTGVTYVVGSTFTTAAAGTGLGDGTVTLNVQGSGKTVASTASNTFNYATTTSQTFTAVTVLTGTITVSTRFNLYMNGTAANYLGGDTIINGKLGLGTAASPSYGTAGQVLTSAGSGASPTWSGISGGTF